MQSPAQTHNCMWLIMQYQHCDVLWIVSQLIEHMQVTVTLLLVNSKTLFTQNKESIILLVQLKITED